MYNVYRTWLKLFKVKVVTGMPFHFSISRGLAKICWDARTADAWTPVIDAPVIDAWTAVQHVRHAPWTTSVIEHIPGQLIISR